MAVKSMIKFYKLRKQPLTVQEEVEIALIKKIYFAYESLIDDAKKIRPEAMHHLKTMTECIIFFYYVDKNGDDAARTVLCEMTINKKKFIKSNTDFSSSATQIEYWQSELEKLGSKGIAVQTAAQKGNKLRIYNGIYRQACEPAHLADLHEYLPNNFKSITLTRSAVSPVWASTTLYQATDLTVKLLTYVSQFFKLNIEKRLLDIKDEVERTIKIPIK
jgi:hypothetical protein